MQTLKMLTLPLALLWCLSPSVMANLGQEIAQTSEEEVADTIEVEVDVPLDIDLPEFDEVPDVGALEAAIDPPPDAPPPPPPVADAPTAAPVIVPDDDDVDIDVDVDAPLGAPMAAPMALPADGTFADTRLGAAFSGEDTIERVAQFIIAFWHQLILDLQLADYSRVDENETEVTAPENPGPCYSSRAMAIAHLAMYDAYVGVTGEGRTYLEYSKRELPTGIDEDILPVAAAAAAGSTAALVLTELYQNPDDQAAIEASRQSFEDNLFEQFDGGIPFVNGTDDWPMIVARNILEDRRDDGAGDPAELAFIPFEQVNGGSNDTYEHTPDPTAVDPESGAEQFLYAPHWGTVKPFLHSEKRLPTLPTTFGIRTIDDGPLANYLEDYREIFDLGRNESDIVSPPLRTQEQTRIGIFWAYDGGFQIGVPPRLYNSITDDIVIDLVGSGDRNIKTGYQLIRLYAMVNVALADSGISAWRDKYNFNFWRPIIGIRRADEDPETDGLEDETWAQLGAPNTNRDRPGINPAFPAYPSGHATFGTSVLEVVKLALHQPDHRKFELYSDEFNGESIDDGYCSKFGDCGVNNTRPFLTRTLTIDEAINENKEGRLYLGVHWRADQDAGVMVGERIAQNVIANFPRRFT